MSDKEKQQETQTPEVEEVVEATTAEASKTEEDIFAEIFGDNSSEFAAQDINPEVAAANEPSEQQRSSDPKENDNQFQYWQSQADKKQVEIDTLKGQMSEMMGVLKSPKSTEANTIGAKEETVKIERPVKPKKPADFDHSEALADPDSGSAKYLKSQTEYVEEMSEYMISLDDQRSKEVQQMQAQQKKVSQETQLLGDLQRNYGYTPDQANDFLQKMTSPDSLSLDNLVKLHQMDLSQGNQTITQISDEALKKQAQMNAHKSKLSIPKPVSVQASVNMQSSKKTQENQMMDSMLTNYKKKNPFS